jgi:quercetin dioxygenase-like cupin family protein
MHATDTLDFAVILDGSIELETESDATVLGVGDCVVQRGTQHRWRVVGDGPCTYLVALFSPQADSPAAAPGVLTHASGDAGHRRVVVSTGEDGRSAISGDGGIPFAVPFPDGGGITDLWHTGWRLASADQGGDLHGPWELETGEAIVWRLVEFPAGPSQEPGFVHTTASIDLDVVLDGELDLALPGSPTTRLATGDLVVQRGTAHAWTNPGTAPARLLAIMIGVPASATDG